MTPSKSKRLATTGRSAPILIGKRITGDVGEQEPTHLQRIFVKIEDMRM